MRRITPSRPAAPATTGAGDPTTTDSLPTSPEQRQPRGLTPLFVGLMLSMLLASLSQTILSTALPTIVGELDGVSSMAWVITGFILVSTITMPIYGKLGDLFGRKPLLVAAIAFFVAGSVMGGLADTMTALVVARCVQGLGGGGLMILSQAIIADVVPARERGRYVGIMGGVFAVSSVAGPLLGGWFTEGPGWRWAFWISLPLGVLAAASALVFLHPPERTTDRPRLDYAGMVLLSVATAAIVLIGAWGGSTYAWSSPTILVLFGIGAVCGALFCLVESRAAEPIIPLHLFRNRNFNLTTAAGLLISVAMFGAISYMPTYLQMTTGASATDAGLLMIPMMAALLVTSVLVGRAVTRTGSYTWYPVAGSALTAVALALLSTMTIGMPLWLLCSYLALLGVGLGLSLQILVLVVQNSFPLREVGTSTAANNYFRQIGASLGSAAVGSLFTSRLLTLLTERLSGSGGPGLDVHSLRPALLSELPGPVQEVVLHAYNDALTPVFLLVVPLAVVAAVLLLFVEPKPLAATLEEAAGEPLDPPRPTAP